MTNPTHAEVVEQLREMWTDLDLTDSERATMEWLQFWDAPSLANLASVLRKARVRGIG